MDLKDALVEAKRLEGWSDEYIAALTKRSTITVQRWMDGTTKMPGDAVVLLQRTSPRFRELSLGAVA